MRGNAMQLLSRAKTAILKQKGVIKTAIGGAEAFGAGTFVGIVEGKWHKEGKLDVFGVPLTLAVGLLGVGAGAADLLDDYSIHAANIGMGMLGAYGHRVGREIGAGMRIQSGQNIAPGVLPPAQVVANQQKALAKNPGAAVGAVELGWQDSFTGEFAIGADPAPLTPDKLEQMVREAATSQ